MKKKHLLLLLPIIPLGIFAYSANIKSKTLPQPVSQPENLKAFTASELARYNGDEPGLPIYLAFEGKVYDITAGKKFYEKGGSYHFLAGKDSTAELNIAGGGIIKSKYPVIGELTK